MSTEACVQSPISAVRRGSWLRFLSYSFFGIIIFFVPINDDKQAPIVALIGICKQFLGTFAYYIATGSSLLLLITYILSKTTNNQALKEHHKNDTFVYGILYFVAVLFPVLVMTKAGPEPLLNEKVGKEALTLAASNVMLTTFIAGFLVVFLMRSGIVDFIGILIEGIMRPLFKLPGEAAVNAMTAFVAAPAVGVFFTNKLYKENVYTQKETIAVITNFSICSIGFFAVLAGLGGVDSLYPKIVITSMVLTFVMGIIIIRIPPVSLKKNVYKNGVTQTKELLRERKAQLNQGSRFMKAWEAGVEKSGDMTFQAIKENFIGAAKFTQKIVAFVLAVATIALFLAEYTPLFQILGAPMVPFLQLFGIEHAAEIAPSTIIGISDMILPVTLLAGKGVSVASTFFIIVLSTLQIIFFTGSATAMMELDVPLKAWELVLIFLIRTIIAIPLVAIATKIVVG